MIFQKTDALYGKIRTGKPFTLEELKNGIAAVDAAIAADPVALRYVQRAELLGSAAATRSLKVSEEQRRAWHRQSKADLEFALGNDPARGLDWTRLALARAWVEGPSRDMPPLILMSMDIAPRSASLWPARLHLILSNWGYFTDAEKERLSEHIAMMWRNSTERVWVARTIYDPID